MSGGGSSEGGAMPVEKIQYKDREGVVGNEKKQFSGPADRNTQPILEILQKVLPTQAGRVLAIAEGSGQHVTAFARAFPKMIFLPTEIDDDAIQSIQAYTEEAQLSNVEAPVVFDTISPDWDVISKGGEYAMVYAVNLCHISPWQATEGLFSTAARLLAPGGTLLVYGPFKVNGQFTSDGNRGFDERLRERNPLWGYREVSAMTDAAAAAGLKAAEPLEVPANNLVLLFSKPP